MTGIGTREVALTIPAMPRLRSPPSPSPPMETQSRARCVGRPLQTLTPPRPTRMCTSTKILSLSMQTYERRRLVRDVSRDRVPCAAGRSRRGALRAPSHLVTHIRRVERVREGHTHRSWRHIPVPSPRRSLRILTHILHRSNRTHWRPHSNSTPRLCVPLSCSTLTLTASTIGILINRRRNAVSQVGVLVSVLEA